MCQSHLTLGADDNYGLGVLIGRSTRGTISNMPNSMGSLEKIQQFGIEDFLYETLILIVIDLLAITDSNTSTLLSTMLQGKKTIVD
jgi:hypothetical protein